MPPHQARGKKFTKQSRFAPVLVLSPDAVFARPEVQSIRMRRLLASARTASCAKLLLAVLSALVLIGSGDRAFSQILDPGWQLVYPGQTAYQSAPLYAPQMAMPAYQPAPMVYPQMAMPQQRSYPPAPVYYAQVPAPQSRAYQPAPAYYTQTPAPQPRGYQPAPIYYTQAPAPQPRPYQPAPVYYMQASAPQPQSYQPRAAYYQQAPAQVVVAPPAAPNSWNAPPQTGRMSAPQVSAPPAPQEVRGFHSTAAVSTTGSIPAAPAATAYQAVPAASPSGYRPAVQYAQAAPLQQQAFGYQQPSAFGYQPQSSFGYQAPAYAPSSSGDMAYPMVDPKYDRQVVDYSGDETPGTVVIDTPHYFLYLVMEDHKAMRYGIGVGRPGFTWSGEKEISAMREWPDWRPPDEMVARRPDLPRYVPGGLENPLGARALYLGSTLYRIHGSNEPWTIGTQVSSGCIRMRNADVIDLYDRVRIGTKVVVM
jgi:lipoprotein-anchoring transpeptidase ErfK/SrfK